MTAKAKATGAATGREIVRLQPLELREIEVDIVGISSLIAHRFSEKVTEGIAGGQAEGDGKVIRKPKPPRDPEAEFEAARHRFPDGRDGFPGLAFKLAMLMAGSRFLNTHGSGTKIKGAFVISTLPHGLLEIRSPTPPVMRCDRALIGGATKTTSLTYRPEYWPWEMTVPMRFMAGQITLQELLDLLQYAGVGVGIGDWRVEKDGDHGQWQIGTVRELG